MTDNSLIKQALIAVLCDHPDAERYKGRVFDNFDQLKEKLAKGGVVVEKKDFLTPNEDGKFMLASENGWRNFHKVVDYIRANGEEFTAADLLIEIDNRDNTFLSSAEEYGALDKLFSKEVWAGRPEEMEKLWYYTGKPARDKFDDKVGFLNVRRELYQAKGKTLREDTLKKAGIDYRDIPDLFSNKKADGAVVRKDFAELKRKLAAAGEHFSKEDIFITDRDGDTMFWSSQAWDFYDQIIETLEEGGERMGVQDFLFKRGDRLSILGRAAGCEGALEKIFNPQHWVGRVEDMMKLWEHVLPAQRGRIQDSQIAELFAEAEDMTYGNLVSIDDGLNKATLLEPLDTSGEGEARVEIIPLGLKSVWKQFNNVRAALALKEESLTLTDLRRVSGNQGNTCLMVGAKAGHFEQVIAIAKASKEKITIEDLTRENKQGYTVLQILADQKQLALAFAPAIWAGRVSEMQSLWQEVPIEARTQVDIADAVSKANQASIRDRLKPRRRAG